MKSPEAINNPNPKLIVDPPWLVRRLVSWRLGKSSDPKVRAKKRAAVEAKRKDQNAPHRVDYFHQLDDPYAHLTAQILKQFVARYDIELVPHLINPTGGKDQPEMEKLAVWSRRDCALIAPHYGLKFPDTAPTAPEKVQQNSAANMLVGMEAAEFFDKIQSISEDLWNGSLEPAEDATDDAIAALAKGSVKLAELGHYSGATFHYGGEFYWGVDRLFYLEQRLMELGARNDDATDYLVSRPAIDVTGLDASNLTLQFYPSLNSPYTSIIYDKTIEMVHACNIKLEHKPVLPMVMRGVPASSNKVSYIMFDTKREAEFLGVPYGPFVLPIGEPTRRAYSLLAWARGQQKDTHFMSALLRLAFAEGVSLASNKGMRRAVTEAGLDWTEALTIIGNNDWQQPTVENQEEMVEKMGLWGVPSYRLTGPEGDPDLEVWGQDRLWLVAAEIRRRCA